MRGILIPGQPEAEPAAEPWPPHSDKGDDQTIRVDEMFACQLDNEFAGHVRGLLHNPETGVAAQRGKAALHAIAAAMPALDDLKERTLAQAIGLRQRAILEPLIETRLDWATGTLGQLAQRATVEVDDASVADRIAGLYRDAALSWQDSAYLRKLGRTAIEELRSQGERRGWENRVRVPRARPRRGGSRRRPAAWIRRWGSCARCWRDGYRSGIGLGNRAPAHTTSAGRTTFSQRRP